MNGRFEEAGDWSGMTEGGRTGAEKSSGTKGGLRHLCSRKRPFRSPPKLRHLGERGPTLAIGGFKVAIICLAATSPRKTQHFSSLLEGALAPPPLRRTRCPDGATPPDIGWSSARRPILEDPCYTSPRGTTRFYSASCFRSASGRRSANITQTQKSPLSLSTCGLLLVAGTGFEPVTFRL